MHLIMATNNAHKAREIREILGGFFSQLDTMRDAGLCVEVVEDGETFAQNAIKKAEEILRISGEYDAALADDSGLTVDYLGGAPGVYSARFAGEGHDDAANNAKLMADMDGVSEEKRGCSFVSAVALARRGRPTVCVSGEVSGVLLTAPRGENGFGYDPYFYYPAFGKSFAELTADQKNSVSHRKNALMNLIAILESEQQA